MVARRLTLALSAAVALAGCSGQDSMDSVNVVSAREAAQTAEEPPSVPADPSRGSVAFRRVLSEAEARRVLGAAGARPYAVFMSIDSLQGAHRVDDDQASLDILAGARRQAALQIGGSPARGGTASRARALVERFTPEQLAANPAELSLARALLMSAEREKKAAALAEADGPFIYGVEFLGGPEVRRRLEASPEVGRVQDGFIVRGRAAAPDPENTSYRQPDSLDLPENRLSPGEVYARLRALADPQATGRCTFSEVPPGASARLERQGSIGDLTLYSEPGGLLCSEPAGTIGDCQIIPGRKVIAERHGRPAVAVSARQPSTYLVYGPERLDCVPALESR